MIFVFSIFFHLDITSGSIGQQDLIVKKGGVLRLVCDVTGVPSPAFSWHKDGRKLSDISAVLQVKFDNDATFGKYTCKASNTVGEHTIVFAIKKICKFLECRPH